MIRCDQTCRPFRPSCSIVSLNKKLHYRCVTICRVTPSFFPIYDSTIFLFLPTFPFLSFPFVSRSIGTRGTIKYAQLRVGFYFPKKPSDLRVSQETKVEQKKRKKFAFARSRGSIHARAKSRRHGVTDSKGLNNARRWPITPLPLPRDAPSRENERAGRFD